MNARPQTDTRNTIDALLETLKERLAVSGTSLVPFLTTMSRFSKYSLWNQMLIFAQRPDATCVMGYRAWNKAGYQVRRASTACAIYAPMLFKNRNSAADPDDTTAPRLGFRVTYVLDVSRVDTLPAPSPRSTPSAPSPPTPIAPTNN